MALDTKLIQFLPQDPFPNVDPAFKEVLTDQQREKLDTSLSPYDLDMFLEVLYEFIVTYMMSECRPDEADQG